MEDKLLLLTETCADFEKICKNLIATCEGKLFPADILFLTSLRFRSLLVFSMYSHNARTFWSPSSAPPKSIT